jgi:hypothetical protein
MKRFAGWLAAATLMTSTGAAALSYTEGPDLTSNLAIPDDLGSLSLGANSVSGSIDMVCSAGDCFFPDDADSFAFEVPGGLVVTTIELIISNYSSSDGAIARVRNFSGGTSSEFITGDMTFPNLVTEPGGLAAGTYDLQVHGIPGFDSETFEDVGSVAFDWQFNMTAIPEPSTVLLLGFSLAALPRSGRLRELAQRRRGVRAKRASPFASETPRAPA